MDSCGKVLASAFVIGSPPPACDMKNTSTEITKKSGAACSSRARIARLMA
ncbi:MAG: hypothetical protein GAK28_04953 [Luteibacter sp.]|nr:MAG: hypothetical protein GAK28_04953 [Luteibacter sp.]